MTPSAIASFSLRRITRFRSMTYCTVLMVGHDHAGELDLADAERAAPARRAEPAQEEARQLPQRIQAQAARHHRIALEVAGEEPVEGRVAGNLELGHDLALAVRAAGLGDAGNAVEHEHRRQRQLGVAGAEQLAPAAGQQILVFVARAGVRPLPSLSHPPRRYRCALMACALRSIAVSYHTRPPSKARVRASPRGDAAGPPLRQLRGVSDLPILKLLCGCEGCATNCRSESQRPAAA